MSELTTLDFLYLVLIFFTTIIWTLLTIAMLRILKVLNVASEIADTYIKIKKVILVYSKIPQIVKEKVLEIIRWEEKEKEYKTKWDN